MEPEDLEDKWQGQAFRHVRIWSVSLHCQEHPKDLLSFLNCSGGSQSYEVLVLTSRRCWDPCADNPACTCFILTTWPGLRVCHALGIPGSHHLLLPSQVLRPLSSSEQCWPSKLSAPGAHTFWRQGVPQIYNMLQVPGMFFQSTRWQMWSCSNTRSSIWSSNSSF